jgi:hypothetical protein
MHGVLVIDDDSHNLQNMSIMNYIMTRGSVDMVDQMCSAYSTVRIKRPWLMAVLLSLMNIVGINTQVLYYFNAENSKNPRTLFFKNLP